MRFLPPLARLLGLTLSIALMGLSIQPACGKGLVYNGGFEEGTTGSLPPGWSPWGSSHDKLLGSFTRDTTRPHSGQACLKIHTPAGSAGYVVTAPCACPSAATEQDPGRFLLARADRERETIFNLTGYSHLSPYVERANLQRLAEAQGRPAMEALSVQIP